MNQLDWLLFWGFLAFVIFDGVRRARGSKNAADLFLAGRSAPWWVMGFSIMATQASAITLIGTTGLGFAEGMRFVQFYFALPVAMVILCFTLVPLYHKYQVFTAYEYLGRRFDRKTRLLSALLFVVLRILSMGIVIYAPSVVLASLFEVPEIWTIILMGTAALVYTALGGMRAVLATDVKQLVVMVVGLIVAFFCIVARLPEDVGFGGALSLADATGRLDLVDWSWDPTTKYNIWNSLIGGTLLFLAYFGADQSQAQRLLAGKSLAHTRGALILNAICKVPFQLLVLLIGALLFVFFIFETQPPSYVPDERHANPDLELPGEPLEEVQVRARAYLAACEEALPGETEAARDAYLEAIDKVEEVRDSARLELASIAGRLREDGKPEIKEVNYVFPHFVLHYMPIGLAGLLMAAILAAALSSIDSELNSVATVLVMDGYYYGLGRQGDDRQRLRVARIATLAVGVLATAFACYAGELGSVIEAVNKVGSYFYGSLLGAFVLAVAIPIANGHGASAGLVGGLISVACLQWWNPDVAWLLLNTAGFVGCVTVGVLISLLTSSTPSKTG